MATASGKSRIVFALLALFLGGFGAQYWYVGKTKAALITWLVLTWLCGIAGIIALVTAIRALTVDDEKFDEIFVNSDKLLPVW